MIDLVSYQHQHSSNLIDSICAHQLSQTQTVQPKRGVALATLHNHRGHSLDSTATLLGPYQRVRIVFEFLGFLQVVVGRMDPETHRESGSVQWNSGVSQEGIGKSFPPPPPDIFWDTIIY